VSLFELKKAKEECVVDFLRAMMYSQLALSGLRVVVAAIYLFILCCEGT